MGGLSIRGRGFDLLTAVSNILRSALRGSRPTSVCQLLRTDPQIQKSTYCWSVGNVYSFILYLQTSSTHTAMIQCLQLAKERPEQPQHPNKKQVILTNPKSAAGKCCLKMDSFLNPKPFSVQWGCRYADPSHEDPAASHLAMHHCQRLDPQSGYNYGPQNP